MSSILIIITYYYNQQSQTYSWSNTRIPCVRSCIEVATLSCCCTNSSQFIASRSACEPYWLCNTNPHILCIRIRNLVCGLPMTTTCLVLSKFALAFRNFSGATLIWVINLLTMRIIYIRSPWHLYFLGHNALGQWPQRLLNYIWNHDVK